MPRIGIARVDPRARHPRPQGGVRTGHRRHLPALFQRTHLPPSRRGVVIPECHHLQPDEYARAGRRPPGQLAVLHAAAPFRPRRYPARGNPFPPGDGRRSRTARPLHASRRGHQTGRRHRLSDPASPAERQHRAAPPGHRYRLPVPSGSRSTNRSGITRPPSSGGSRTSPPTLFPSATRRSSKAARSSSSPGGHGRPTPVRRVIKGPVTSAASASYLQKPPENLLFPGRARRSPHRRRFRE